MRDRKWGIEGFQGVLRWVNVLVGTVNGETTWGSGKKGVGTLGAVTGGAKMLGSVGIGATTLRGGTEGPGRAD